MLGNNFKTIGVFLSHVNSEYQDALCRGINTKARELDYNVVFFNDFGGYGQYDYDIGEVAITELPNYEELSGIILDTETMWAQKLEARYRDNIKNRCHCPIISVRREIEEYDNVLVDEYTSLDDLLRHIIKEHNITCINFLAGPKGYPDSDKRLAAYKKILSEYNIPIEEERIYYGDFWKKCGAEAVDYWLSSPISRPQAIVCANDYMAMGACNKLADRGLLVPDDIIVTGYDGIEAAAQHYPPITTVRMPVYEMGLEAVMKIHKHLLGMEQPHNTYMKTIPIYRTSCGCNRNWLRDRIDYGKSGESLGETLTWEMLKNNKMSTDLTGLTSLDEIMEKLLTYIYDNENFSHFCLCLRENWYDFQEPESEAFIRDEVIMELGIKNRISYTKLKCPKKELIPIEFAEDKPMSYFFTMLHHQQHNFGYVGISYKTIQTIMPTFHTWLININNALENVRVHSELNRLIYQLEEISIRDDLTNLYNRRALNTIGKSYLKQCIEAGSNLMVFTADMDKLKYINDKFGHSYGDVALKVVAEAMQQASNHNEICIRMGGDEFMAIGMDYDEEKLTKFIERFVESLNRFNFINDYDFSVHVSYGSHLILPDENTSIENCLGVADMLMYLQKSEKESKRIKDRV